MSNHKANPFATNTSVRRPARVRDGYARELAVGDEVILPSLKIPRWRVTAIRPAFEPGIPPNMMHVTVAAEIRLVAAADMPVAELLRVRTNAELVAVGVPEVTAAEPGELENDDARDADPDADPDRDD